MPLRRPSRPDRRRLAGKAAWLALGIGLLMAGAPSAAVDLGPLGTFDVWSRVEIALQGPPSQGMSQNANPFRVEVAVTFSGPGGTFTVPAFYDGDGIGGLDGDVWKVRFSPPRAGAWSFVSAAASEPLLDGVTGSFQVVSPNCAPRLANGLENFACVGRLVREDGHYLRFEDGGRWLQGGVNEPEDFLAPGQTAGFPSDEDAIDYLVGKGANSIYLLLHNIRGDDRNVWPWVGASESQARSNDDRFDVAKLLEWEALFAYIQERGMVLHLVFEDDSGWTGFDRELYYREMVARFGHHNGLIWNLSEEYNENYSAQEILDFAQSFRDLDAYDHPLTVHQEGSLEEWAPFLGNPLFDLTSFQTASAPQNPAAVEWFGRVEASGRTIPTGFHETTRSFDENDRELFRHVAWSVYLGGGNNELFTRIPTSSPSGGPGSLADYDEVWEDLRRAREFMEGLRFWAMRPANDRVAGGQAYAFAEGNRRFGLYFPDGDEISFDLEGSPALLHLGWTNPRSDVPERSAGNLAGAGTALLTPPNGFDWAAELVAVRDLSGGASLTSDQEAVEVDPLTGEQTLTAELTLTNSADRSLPPLTLTLFPRGQGVSVPSADGTDGEGNPFFSLGVDRFDAGESLELALLLEAPAGEDLGYDWRLTGRLPSSSCGLLGAEPALLLVLLRRRRRAGARAGRSA